MFLRVIACEIAFREICYLAARAQNIIDLEFLPQGHHDLPTVGRKDIQSRINAVPEGKYDAILLGYGLCSNMLSGIQATHTPIVIPRAHDCITFFLGSAKRYQEFFVNNPGTYYYTSGWLECRKRRGDALKQGSADFLSPSSSEQRQTTYQQWVQKYGEERAQFLLQTLGDWNETYSHGALIDFDFTKPLKLGDEVSKICNEHGWQFQQVQGDLGLLEHWLAGDWKEEEFLVLPPGKEITPTNDEKIIGMKN
jgi:hypothetical protein